MSNNIKPIRVATICHHEDDARDKNHRQVRVELVKEAGGGLVWRYADGSEAGYMGANKTVRDAEIAAMQCWGADEWDLRATWRGKGGFTIESRAGVVFGFYPGETPKEAFLAMLADSGDDYGSPTAGTEDDWIIH
ncbi:MAG: hypothetical protein FNT29_06105 [Halothiobacillaceae bacterium]|nr:MAG: hypothetical protein FNT29_06105 [Halothiobacillaceae bacterium]